MKSIYGKVFYTSEEAALVLGITPRTLTRWFQSDNSLPESAKEIHIADINGRKLFESEGTIRLAEDLYGVKVDRIQLQSELREKLSSSRGANKLQPSLA